jgi:hypothetical protein
MRTSFVGGSQIRKTVIPLGTASHLYSFTEAKTAALQIGVHGGAHIYVKSKSRNHGPSV